MKNIGRRSYTVGQPPLETEGYAPTSKMINALNDAELYHGSAFGLVCQETLDEEICKWEYEEGASFGGLYVTTHVQYAKGAAEQTENYLKGIEAKDIKTSLHKITLLPGVLLALDEDEFGWYRAIYEYHNYGGNEWATYLKPQERIIDLAIYKYNIMPPFKELHEYVENLGWDDYITAEEVIEEVEGYTLALVEIVLKTWMEEGSQPYTLPNLRILNDRFIAEPSLPERIEK